MKAELQEKLYSKYPKIFRQKDLPMNQTCMCWGIECGDGWYDILDTLCAWIQNRIDWQNRKEETVGQVEAVQVKEKFGGLRFYINGGDEEIYAAISMAEALSYRVCEICGSRGRQTKSGWIETLCDKHAAERGLTLRNEEQNDEEE